MPNKVEEDLISKIRKKYKLQEKYFNEKNKRFFAWAEALSIWYWWIEIVHKATKLSRNTIKRWMLELEDPEREWWRIRKKWWWRKKKIDNNSRLERDLENLLEPITRWDPESPLKRTSKSLHKISNALKELNHNVSHSLVSRILKEKWYSLQWNRKVQEWLNNNPDRNSQFEYISNKAQLFQKSKEPVISVDTKKKENIWNFKNNWREYHKKWCAPEVNVYDFLDKEKWKVSPYWIYDLDKNKWWVSVWISNDTAEFAVNSIRSWWYNMWKNIYKWAKKLYINADWWWSNWYRVRLWKIEIQKLANEIDMEIHISHFPPWTSKWNKIEHRMFSFISKNWRWKPLIDHATVVNLIWNTTTTKWLKIEAILDKKEYLKWIKISDKELAKVNIKKGDFHWEWNYIILPKNY